MCDYSLKPLTHHDALEFSDGQIVLLTDLFANSAPASSTIRYGSRGEGPRNGSRTSADSVSQERVGRPRLSACFATVTDLGELVDLGQQGGAKDILGRVYEYTLCAE